MHSFRGGGAKLVFLKKNWSKKGFRKKNVHLFWGEFRFSSLLLHDVTRCFRRVCKKTYKNRVVLAHPVARFRRNRKKKKKKGPKKSNTQKMGGLENGQEVVPPFFSKKSGFSKSSKTPIFIAFPEKMCGNHFF